MHMKKDLQESKKRIAFPICLFDELQHASYNELPDEIHVVPTGKWDHPYFGEIVIDTEDVAEFVTNFKNKVRNDLPITAGHDNGMSGGELPAIGWFRELIDRGVKGLYAVVEWTEEGKRLLSQKAFKYFSAELYHEYEDPQTGARYSNVLVGGALTNKPYFKDLDPVVAFSEPTIFNQFSEESMDLTTLLAKDVAVLTDEEKAFIREHKEELTDEQKGALASVLEDAPAADAPTGDETGDGAATGTDGDGSGDGKGAGDDAGAGETPAADAPEPAPAGDGQTDLSEGKTITMSASEAAILRQKADAGERAFNELQAMKLGSEADKMVFSTANKTGHFAPRQRDALVSFLTTLSEKQRDQFKNLVHNMPKAQVFGEVGSSEGAESAPLKEIETLAKAKIEGGASYSEAVKQVLAENPELRQRYEDSLADN